MYSHHSHRSIFFTTTTDSRLAATARPAAAMHMVFFFAASKCPSKWEQAFFGSATKVDPFIVQAKDLTCPDPLQCSAIRQHFCVAHSSAFDIWHIDSGEEEEEEEDELCSADCDDDSGKWWRWWWWYAAIRGNIPSILLPRLFSSSSSYYCDCVQCYYFFSPMNLYSLPPFIRLSFHFQV